LPGQGGKRLLMAPQGQLMPQSDPSSLKLRRRDPTLLLTSCASARSSWACLFKHEASFAVYRILSGDMNIVFFA